MPDRPPGLRSGPEVTHLEAAPNVEKPPQPPDMAMVTHAADAGTEPGGPHPRAAQYADLAAWRQRGAWAQAILHLHDHGLPAAVPEDLAAWLRRRGVDGRLVLPEPVPWLRGLLGAAAAEGDGPAAGGPRLPAQDRRVMTPAEPLDQALAYAAAGWPVFPATRRSQDASDTGRAPAPGDPARLEPADGECGRQGHGFHDASHRPGASSAGGGAGGRTPTSRSPPARPGPTCSTSTSGRTATDGRPSTCLKQRRAAGGGVRPDPYPRRRRCTRTPRAPPSGAL